MRSGITYAALLTAASASAIDYNERLVARNHVAEYLADLVARSNLDVPSDASDEYLVGRGYDEDYYMDNLMARDDEAQFYDTDMLYARHPDAEPILGFNHLGKWIGQAAGAVSGGFKSRSNGKYGQYAKPQRMNPYGDSQGLGQGGLGAEGGAPDLMRRGAEDYEQVFYVREAEPEPEFEYYDEYLPYRRSIDDISQDALFYAREAEPEPVLGLNHLGKWTGQAAGSVVGGFRSRSGGKSSKAGKHGGSVQYERREADLDMPYEDELYIREADADAEPILGLNTIGKWVGQAAGSVAGGFRKKSGGKGKEGKKDKGGKEGKAGKNYGGGGADDMMGGGGGGAYGGGMSQGSFI